MAMEHMGTAAARSSAARGRGVRTASAPGPSSADTFVLEARLPTNWMDRAILAQTYPGRPMTTHHVLDVAVAFDRAHLFGAVDALMRAEPALRSIVRESRRALERHVAGARWSKLERLVTYTDVAIDLSGDEWLVRPFDLAVEEHFRVLHSPRRGGKGYQLVFTLHHGVTDGVGALALFAALLAHYAQLSGEGGIAAPPLRTSGARLRTLLRRRGPHLVASLLRDNLQRAGRFTDRRASLLESPNAFPATLRCTVIELPLSRWEALRTRARGLGCTRNDLMLAAFLRAAAAWRRESGMPDEDFRALVPVDLRREFGIGPCLGNHFGVVEADFTNDEVDAANLPATVAARMKAERTPERVLATPLALAVLCTMLPPFVARRCFRWLDERATSFMYSFLFSHIRVPEGLHVPASLGAERIYCLSGLPRQPGIGLTVTALPAAVTIALAYTPPRLSDAGAARLVAHFVAALDEV